MDRAPKDKTKESKYDYFNKDSPTSSSSSSSSTTTSKMKRSMSQPSFKRSLSMPISGSFIENTKTSASTVTKFYFRKRFFIIIGLVSLVVLAPLINFFIQILFFSSSQGAGGRTNSPLGSSSTDSNLTQEERANITFKNNPFFDQVLFTEETKSAFADLFQGVYYEPGTLFVKEGDQPALLIVENGSCSIVPDDDEEESYLDFRTGDSIGGLNLLFNQPFLYSYRSRYYSQGVFVWRSDSKKLLELIVKDKILLTGIERKFLQSYVEKTAKRPIFFFPGFASVQMVAWKAKKCTGTSISIGERVWVNLEKLMHDNIFDEQCWLKCMMLDPVEQTDPPDCKLRPEEGLNSINSLLPGIITGLFTVIFKNMVDEMSMDFGYDISNLVALPYDWRLSPLKLEQRDQYFSKTKKQIEHAVSVNSKKPGITICHSMGCNIIHYFLDWMKKKYPETSQQWIDDHIGMHFSISAPFLGAPEATKGVLSGLNFGLPTSVERMREMGASFSSSLMLLPRVTNVSHYDNGWTQKFVKVKNGRNSTSFKVDDITSKKIFEKLMEMIPSDKTYSNVLRSITKNYESDEVKNMLISGPERPSIRRIVAIYGVNVPTEFGYTYRLDKRDNNTKLIMEDMFFEKNHGVVTKVSQSLMKEETEIGENGFGKSGDGTVGYGSLSWANSWHDGDVKKMVVPSSNRVDLDKLLNVLPGESGKMITKNGWLKSINTLEPSYTKYESHSKEKGELVVIEIESVSHRDAVKDDFLIKLLKDELCWLARKDFLYHPKRKSTKVDYFSWLHDQVTIPSWFSEMATRDMKDKTTKTEL